MVYNVTYSVINTSLWDPTFSSPMVGSNLCAVDQGTFMADRYIGDMLLNLMLSEEVRLLFYFIIIQEVIPFCGVYVMNVRKQEEWEKDVSGGWEIWEREMMRLTYLPYNKCWKVMWYIRLTLGYMLSLKNPFGW